MPEQVGHDHLVLLRKDIGYGFVSLGRLEAFKKAHAAANVAPAKDVAAAMIAYMPLSSAVEMRANRPTSMLNGGAAWRNEAWRIIVVPISGGYAPYLDWIAAETERSKEASIVA